MKSIRKCDLSHGLTTQGPYWEILTDSGERHPDYGCGHVCYFNLISVLKKSINLTCRSDFEEMEFIKKYLKEIPGTRGVMPLDFLDFLQMHPLLLSARITLMRPAYMPIDFFMTMTLDLLAKGVPFIASMENSQSTEPTGHANHAAIFHLDEEGHPCMDSMRINADVLFDALLSCEKTLQIFVQVNELTEPY